MDTINYPRIPECKSITKQCNYFIIIMATLLPYHVFIKRFADTWNRPGYHHSYIYQTNCRHMIYIYNTYLFTNHSCIYRRFVDILSCIYQTIADTHSRSITWIRLPFVHAFIKWFADYTTQIWLPIFHAFIKQFADTRSGSIQQRRP